MTLTPQASNLLSDRNLQIGNICFQWAHLEYLLALAIWSILRIDDETGKILTGGTDIKARCAIALNLAKHLEAPEAAVNALAQAQKSIDKLNDKRNRAVHGHRLFDPARPDTEYFEVHRGSSRGVKVPQTNADLAQLGKDIATTHKALLSALLANGVYDTSPQRPDKIIARKTSNTHSEIDSQPAS